jgi:hypothetical protein
VSGVDAGGIPLILDPDPLDDEPIAGVTSVTGGEGRFTLYDPKFEGGTVEVAAVVDGATYRGTAYSVPLTDSKIDSDPGLSRLKKIGMFTNLAFVNITLPPIQAAPPAPKIRIRVFENEGGERKATSGVVLEGTPLLIGLEIEAEELDKVHLPEVAVNGEAQGARADDPRHPMAMDWVFDYTPATGGAYTVSARLVPAYGPVIESSYTFRVLATGGSVMTPAPGPPGVITAQTAPKHEATGVPVTVYPQVYFTEPVQGVTQETVGLTDSRGNPVALSFLGVGLDEDGNPVALDSVMVTSKVVSLTLVPLQGLSYSTTYTLRVTSGLTDLDVDEQGVPAPNALSPEYQSSFKTFGPETVGGSEEKPQAAGLVVLDDRAYLAETLYTGGSASANQRGALRIFDIQDPALPEELPGSAEINFPPRDIAGEVRGGARTVAVVTAPRTYYFVQGEVVYYTELRSTPANLFLYDVTTDEPRWIGAASLANNIVDGIPNRIVMKDGFAYTASLYKGLQVIDLGLTRAGFPEGGFGEADQAAYQIRQALFTGGYNGTAAVVTVPVPDWKWSEEDPTVQKDLDFTHLPLLDLDVADLVVSGQGKRLMLATGSHERAGLTIADTLSSRIIWRGILERDISKLVWGSAIVAARISGLDLALVGGYATTPGGATTALAVVDLSPMAEVVPEGARIPDPEVIALFPLPEIGSVGDILMTGNTAIVSGDGKALLVDLTLPSQPQVTGTLEGVGSRLALSDDGILFSTERSFIERADGELDGIQTAAFVATPIIRRVDAFPVNRAGLSLEDVLLDLAVVPSTTEVDTAELEIYEDQVLSRTQNLPLFRGDGTSYTVAKGSPFSADRLYHARLVINRGMQERERSSVKAPLRPAILDVVGVHTPTAEIQLEADRDPVDVVKLFVSAPEIELRSRGFTGVLGGIGNHATLELEGTVRSAIAPIEQVIVNEDVIRVTQKNAGPSGLGPYEGVFTARAEVGPQAEPVTAYAIDAERHVSSQTLGIYPEFNSPLPGFITGRAVQTEPPLVPGATSAAPSEFVVTLKDKASTASSVQVALETGVETKTLLLKRVGAGDLYQSEPLVALPANVELPTGASAATQQTRVRVRLGSDLITRYGRVRGRSVVSGINVRAASEGVSEWVDPGASTTYEVELGMPGKDLATVNVSASGLAFDFSEHSSPVNLALKRQSDDPRNPLFNLYRPSSESERLAPVMEGVAGPPHGRQVEVVPFGRLKVAFGDTELVLPVGSGADHVRWETRLAKPFWYYESEQPPSWYPESGPTSSYPIPDGYFVKQEAVFLRGETPIPGLTVLGFLDRRAPGQTRMVGITACAAFDEAGKCDKTDFPLITDDGGRVRFEVYVEGTTEPQSEPLLGVALALVDRVGLRALGRLGKVTPPVTLADTVPGGPTARPTETPIIAGYATYGGLPRRHGDWLRRFAEAFMDRYFERNPAMKTRIEDAIRLGLGNPTDDLLREYKFAFFMGLYLGAPIGVFDGARDSVVGLYDLGKGGYHLVRYFWGADEPGGEAQELECAMSGADTRCSVESERRRNKLDKALEAMAVALQVMSDPDIGAPMLGQYAATAIKGYETGPRWLMQQLGIPENGPPAQAFLLGFVAGGVVGYMIELGAEMAGAGALTLVVGEGAGAFLPVLMRAAKAGKAEPLWTALSKFGKFLMTTEDPSLFARYMARFIQLLDALGPDCVARFATRVVEVEQGPQRALNLVRVYELADDTGVTLLRMGDGLREVENVGDAMLWIEKLADAEFRGADRLVVFSADKAADAAKAVGRGADIAKEGAELEEGFDALLRGVDRSELYWAELGSRSPGDMDSSIRGAIEFSECP